MMYITVVSQPRFGLRFQEPVLSMVPAESPADQVKPVALEPWSEPLTIEALMDQYIVEGKFAGRSAGTTLYLTRSKTRAGEITQCEEGQRWKLFLVPCPCNN